MDDSSLNYTPQQMKHTIKKLTSNKATGPNKITTTTLKLLPIKSIVQICYIFKPSALNFFYFLTAWNIAIVIPIPKQGKSATVVECYIPISLLSTTNNLFEKIVIAYLLTLVNNSNIIIPKRLVSEKPNVHASSS